jgi:hypothetical protein
MSPSVEEVKYIQLNVNIILTTNTFKWLMCHEYHHFIDDSGDSTNVASL